ncbi:MAG: glycosyltransferase family 4 protein [Candidatus Korarchaeota archaeon]|nr:glycosyltransferase family 4 protein [Candidatus Korarchaeota archaeon]NIU82489.1 glycosyltransferase [Candidatus Thorarchaeota archaeon]NIW12975.1 glycosyltransferase [Candidatus Thorarchaeota archaeon]NIW51128.1 glycosyltransferase [Candidatus Korarchaeota archaeon]
MSFSVCHIHRKFYTSTPFAYLRQITQILASYGINVSVISRKEEKNNVSECKIVNGVKVYPTNIPSSFPTFSSLFKLSYRLMSLPKKFDILHCYGSLMPLVGLTKRLQSNNPKIVFDIRTVPVVPWGFSATNPGKFLYYKLSSRISVGTIFISETVKNYLSEVCSLSPKKYAIVPTGVNLAKFKPENVSNLKNELGLMDKFVYGYAGAITYQRHLQTMVKAFAKLARAKKKVTLLMCGSGSSLPYLKNLAKRLGIEEKTIFLGFVEFKKIHKFMNIFDVGLNYVPNTLEYNVQPPTKLYQYLACGLPTISTKTRANQNIIQQRENGLLCGFNVSSFYEAMRELLLDTHLRRTLSSNARTSVAHMNWERIVKERLLPFYRKLLG